ncbi:Ser/Thr protein phosphatase [Tritrichomonas foetus]|uniref:Serine/threonine-protein phosphatase n=1 Tax=Tritrichomonas foetus TaxID=1144522 RepID=A0A1J4KUG9_9EUKA|nr:Ser/Thr protein phosphatase [Tritrichomonas foetus]|eukprot:OHT13141.1 Ser/Thr protein phosphatase [Tritrichomonas foetus]
MSFGAATILKAYNPYISELTFKEIVELGIINHIPCFGEKIIFALCDEVFDEIKKSEPVIHLESPTYSSFYVIGDIHGNLHDLIRIINEIPNFYETKILFLGDYVDRGSYSLDVVCLLFALKVKYPNSIYLLRGNHEFEDTNSVYGFQDECLERYECGEEIYQRINEIFNYLPIAAVIGEVIFAVHGGISPLLNTMEDIEKIEFPLTNCDNELISDLMWSDPDPNKYGFLVSKRGRGKTFGFSAVKSFFKVTHFKKIIRAHQCMQHGIGSLYKGKLLTVFSTSYYTSEENCAAYLEINKKCELKPHKLNPYRYVPRSNALYFMAVEVTSNIRRLNSIAMNLQLPNLDIVGASAVTFAEATAKSQKSSRGLPSLYKSQTSTRFKLKNSSPSKGILAPTVGPASKNLLMELGVSPPSQAMSFQCAVSDILENEI